MDAKFSAYLYEHACKPNKNVQWKFWCFDIYSHYQQKMMPTYAVFINKYISSKFFW